MEVKNVTLEETEEEKNERLRFTLALVMISFGEDPIDADYQPKK